MHSQQLSRISSVVLVLLSLVALFTVVTGLIWPPPVRQADEGTQAHIFQISIVGLLPMAVLVVSSADWHRPWPSARPLIFASVATMLAFAGLYYLEHLR